MKITQEHIKNKKIVGESGKGKPLIYVETSGGLHTIFTKDEDGQIMSIAAAPHIGVMKWMAEKQDKDIKWDSDFLKNGSNFQDKIEKSEESQQKKIRNLLFFKTSNLIKSDVILDTYIYYSVKEKYFSILKKDEIFDRINQGLHSNYDLIRPLDLSHEKVFLEDTEFLKRDTNG